MLRGIDVSHWDGDIDWALVKQSGQVDFAYIKCTDVNMYTGIPYVDDKYDQNVTGARSVGILTGAFHYYQPGASPLLQAEFFSDHCDCLELPPVVDVEEKYKAVRGATFGNNLFIMLTEVATRTVASPVVYASPGYLNYYLYPTPSWTHNYRMWAASWSLGSEPTLASGWYWWWMWQWSCKGKVRGIVKPNGQLGDVDLNRFERPREELTRVQWTP